MRFALVLFLAFLATGVAGLAGIAQHPATPAAAVAPAPRPSAAFSRLFDQYRHGDAAAAIGSFARWNADRIVAEALRPADVDARDTIALEALALLHTDAGIANGHFGLFADTSPKSFILGGWGLEGVFEVHSYTAYKIVDALAQRGRTEHDDALLAFARRWYVVALSACAGGDAPELVDASAGGMPSPGAPPNPVRGMSRGAGRSARPDAPPDNSGFRTAANGKAFCAEGLSDKARHDFSDDAEVMMTLGTLREPREMTQAQVAALHRPFDLEYGQKALYDFDDALRIDPALSEARLRKAHLLHIARNEPASEAMLEQSLAESRAANDPFVLYLSALFLGEIHEDHGDLAGAVPYYRQAVTACRAHTASIALGQALIRSGHAADGWAAGARMFGREGQGAEPIADPWVLYRRVGYWQLDDRLTVLRDMVRGR